MSPLLVVEHLGVTYRTTDGLARAVEDVSFELERGELLAVVGESGSGKTTLALSLVRLLPEPVARLDPGSRIVFDGADLAAMGPHALRQIRGSGIGMVFQDPSSSLNPVLSVGSQLVEVLRAHHALSRAAARRRALELLASVGIDRPELRFDQYAHQLSGGLQQRAAIALALAGGPKLLIADEPTTALDVTVQAQILELLVQLKQQLHLAILLITHDLGVAAGVADRVAVMYAGRLVETADTSSLFEHPNHPYTAALLGAVPRADREGLPIPIPGQPPRATAWPPGCRFHPRCPEAWARCSREEPPLLPAGPRRQARCWLVEESRAGRAALPVSGDTPTPPSVA
jgi:oligopeptide/dipeptide ABC transporter ATP-binding protein